VAEIEGLSLADKTAHYLPSGRGKDKFPRKKFSVFGEE